ncbi:MAG: hypothetical protein U0794_11370 [Isosphaeraceae bacterium]
MSVPEETNPLTLLNVFDVKTEGQPRRLLCFVDQVTAGSKGIDPRAVVGEFPYQEGGEPGPDDLRLNQGFVHTFILYMNEVASKTEGLRQQAKANAGKTLYVIDPRLPSTSEGEPQAHDVLGVFQVNDEGEIVADSFGYNPEHRWFAPNREISGVFTDRAFYAWLHPDVGALGGGELDEEAEPAPDA